MIITSGLKGVSVVVGTITLVQREKVISLGYKR